MSLHHCEANGKLDRLRPKKVHHDPCAFSFDVHAAERMKASACAGIDEALLSAFGFKHLAEARERRFYKWLDVQDIRHVRRRSMFTTNLFKPAAWRVGSHPCRGDIGTGLARLHSTLADRKPEATCNRLLRLPPSPGSNDTRPCLPERKDRAPSRGSRRRG